MRQIKTSMGFRLALIAAWLVALFMVLPVLIVLPASLTPNNYLSLTTPDTWTLKQYATFFDPGQRWLGPLIQSLVIASGSTIISVALGTACAVGIWRIGGRYGQWILLLVLTPLIVPVVALAIGSYKVWVQIGLFDTYIGAMIAHSVQTMPLVVLAILAALSTIDLTLERAVLSLGGSSWTFIRYVLIPVLRPAIFSSAALAFLLSWDELVMTIFVSGRTIVTLPKRMWEAVRTATDPVVAVAASVMIFATFALVVASFINDRRRLR
ncbi:ABC transporter permease [Mesorhizobium sp. AaZ16]|uniref:ABC transporter permease n=1 Tax=Mesorhizobium sp. AaZ16 TaxID=3402289 RepID=UPI00374F6859